MKWAYYNENDPKAAAWLRELIKRGHIASGEVDERSILDVRPDDVKSFCQAHYFAGIGVWSCALRLAGWPDDKPVWTGSAPCQPFSAAGKGNGFADERHLWPFWFHLIQQGKPAATPVFGEQVASRDGLTWLDLVLSDMEGTAHTFRAVDLCAAGFGAPHIRQRLFWVADPARIDGRAGLYDSRARCGCTEYGNDSKPGGLADMQQQGLEGLARHGNGGGEPGRLDAGQDRPVTEKSIAGGLGNPSIEPCERDTGELPETEAAIGGKGEQHGHSVERPEYASSGMGRQQPGPTNGFWRDADWLGCRDAKWRPVESRNESMVDGLADSLGYSRIGGGYSLNPLAQKAERRVMRLKGYGNAINAQVAAEFIKATTGIGFSMNPNCKYRVQMVSFANLSDPGSYHALTRGMVPSDREIEVIEAYLAEMKAARVEPEGSDLV